MDLDVGFAGWVCADAGALPDRPAELADTPLREHLVCDGFWKDGGAVCQVRQASTGLEQSKQFFLEKKNQKTLAAAAADS